MTHGHYYGVNAGTSRLVARAKELECDVAMYGHTHIPDIEYHGNLTVVCPGSLTEPRQMGRIPTYAIMEERPDKKIDIKIIELK